MQKIIKFAISGASAAGINLSLFYVLEQMLSLNYAIAVIISTICAALYHFSIQRIWVFRAGDSGSIKSEGYLFFIACVINLILNEVLLVLFIGILAMNSLLAQFISLGLLACMNFVIYEKIIFKKDSNFAHMAHNVFEKIRLKHVLLAALVGAIILLLMIL